MFTPSILRQHFGYCYITHYGTVMYISTVYMIQLIIYPLIYFTISTYSNHNICTYTFKIFLVLNINRRQNLTIIITITMYLFKYYHSMSYVYNQTKIYIRDFIHSNKFVL